MKKIRNCKVILALAICLTMFAGLALTASAMPAAPKCYESPCLGGPYKQYSYSSAIYCSGCHKNTTMYVFKCRYYSNHYSTGICGNCNKSYTIYG